MEARSLGGGFEIYGESGLVVLGVEKKNCRDVPLETGGLLEVTLEGLLWGRLFK